MSEPDITVRQFPLAVDKWLNLVIGPALTMLGLTIDTNWLMVDVPAKYVTGVRDVINKTWHKN